MKSYGIGLAITFLLVLGSATGSFSQESKTAAVEAQQLRNELSQMKDREAEIGLRLQELEYELKPENIERYFAGTGSTRPEDLREARRKKLQLEKDRLQQQLNEIGQDRPRLEAAIQNAETRAYYESAMAAPGASQNRMSPLAGLLVGRNRKVATITGAVILVCVMVALARRTYSRGKRRSEASNRPPDRRPNT